MTRIRYKFEGEGWIARVLNGFCLRNEWLQPQASAERTRCTTGKESITNEPNAYHIFPILDHDLGVSFIHCSSEGLVVSAQLLHWFIVITTWESKSSLASGVHWRTVAINFQEYVGWRREPPSYCRPKKRNSWVSAQGLAAGWKRSSWQLMGSIFFGDSMAESSSVGWVSATLVIRVAQSRWAWAELRRCHLRGRVKVWSRFKKPTRLRVR